jgi:hypothetical protein
MPFKIKYNEEKALENFRKIIFETLSISAAMEKNGSFSIKSPALEALVSEQAVAEMEKERTMLQKFMDSYSYAKEISIISIKNPYPESDEVKLTNKPGYLTVKALFFQLGLGEDKLAEVYDFSYNSSFMRLDFKNSFSENGKQSLASILEKKVTFYIDNQGILIKNPVVYEPSGK